MAAHHPVEGNDPAATMQLVETLLDLASGDPTCADLYLRRARTLLAPTLPRSQFEGMRTLDADLATTVKHCTQAAQQHDWARVEEMTAQAEQLRRRASESAKVRDTATRVYEPRGVAIDPFSPGFEFLAGARDPAEVRDALVAQLTGIERADPDRAAFYRGRRAYLTDLALASRRAEADTANEKEQRSLAELEQLATQAAQRGDLGELRRLAQEILELEKAEPVAARTQSRKDTGSFELQRCPVDLAAPLPEASVERARGLGFAAARTEPIPGSAALHAYVAARIWSPDPDAAHSAAEGAMRAATAVEDAGFPQGVAEPVKVLVGQLLRNFFVSSGGARYVPRFVAESVLIEDFREDAEPPAEGELLRALGLPRRRGLARIAIDEALLEHGATIVGERLALDPDEFRLVCIPQDLYMRFGRDHGWGERQQWTHFDGYQVLRDGTLRALAGGDVRYGGLADLVSIDLADERQSVIARFAVIRRARQVARWI